MTGANANTIYMVTKDTLLGQETMKKWNPKS